MSALIVILESLFVKLVFTVGIFGLCGAFISLANRCFYEYTGKFGNFVLRVTGLIGTPVHELSHAFMCLIFGHKIHEIKMYNFKKRSKVLGYVSHSYVKRNLYQQMGNFFIGVSPIIAGGLVVTGSVRLLTPSVYKDVAAWISSFMASDGLPLGKLIAGIPRAIFGGGNVRSILWWVCMLLSLAVTVHMEISRSDIKGGLKGLAVVSAFLLVTDVILGFLFPEALLTFTRAVVSFGLHFSAFLIIPMLFSTLLLVLSLLIKLIKMIAESVSNDRKED